MKFLLATKVQMTQVFDEHGNVVPVTKVHAGPVFVVQVKTKGKEGVDAIVVGFQPKKKAKKPQVGQAKTALSVAGEQTATAFTYLREFPVENPKQFQVGQKLTTTIFAKGDAVKVTGISKGQGFQGVVKRHGFSGSPATHGHKDQLRMPGSIGSGFPQKTFKGQRMGGRMGTDQVTVRGLTIVAVDAEHDELLIKGAVPGAPKSLLKIFGPGEIPSTKASPKEEAVSDAVPASSVNAS